jgi:hypothetical protein
MSAAAQLSRPTPGEIAAGTDQMPRARRDRLRLLCALDCLLQVLKCVLGLVDA